MNLLEVKPKKNVLYGVTHDMQGNAIVRVPRSVKIGIGLPGGKDIEVFIDYNNTWVINMPGCDPASVRYTTKAEVQKNFPLLAARAKERKYPKKLSYFTFTKPGSVEYDPDFDAIEHHGPKPTEIDIVFVDNEPEQLGFQMWTKSEMKCYGDGVNALRVLSMARTPEEKALAEQAKAAGADRFPIIDGCFSRGCPYAGKECKPTGQLNFQLVSTPRLGATAYFHTTSFRSVVNLSSCLGIFRALSGGGDPERGFVKGIPLKLVLRKHKVTMPDGKTSHAYNVALEFRAEDAAALSEKLISAGLDYQRRIEAPRKQLAAAAEPVPEQTEAPAAEVHDAEPVGDDDSSEEYTDVPAAAVAAEFFPDEADGEDFSEGGKSAGPEIEEHPHGSAEAAGELGQLKIRMAQAGRSKEDIDWAAKRYAELVHEGKQPEAAMAVVTAEDLARVDPEEKKAPAAPAEPTVNQSQWTDMLTYAKDELKMSDRDLRDVCKKYGHESGDYTSLPLRLFHPIMKDLQTPTGPREVKEEKKKQGRFSL